MESHAAQDVQLVLMHAKEYPLASGGVCNFVVGLKDCLKEPGAMNSTATNVGGWNACERRTWCNTVLPQAFPETLRPIFKQMKTTTDNGANVAITSDDMFALFAEKEVFGTNTYGSAAAEATLFQIEWYKTAANRRKKTNNAAGAWVERSASYGMVNRFANVSATGTATDSFNPAQYPQNLSPFACI